MRPVITAETSAALDAAAPDPVSVLMNRAGFAVAAAAARMGAQYGARVVILAGPGNNGGDGYVAAAYLARRGVFVTVVAFADPATPACQSAAERAREAGVRLIAWSSQPVSCDLLIDALFGGGFRGTLPAQVVPWLDHPAPVLAIDIPSGVSADTGTADGPAFEATVTISFHAAKVSHFVGSGPRHAGLLEVVDIGLSGGEASFWTCEDSDAPLPSRPRNAHKWSVGSVMVTGGVKGMTGAALLAARSALRFGAGAVSIGTTARLQPLYASLAPEILTTVVGEAEGYGADAAAALLEAAARYDVLVLGPGLGSGEEEFVDRIVRGRVGGLLLDADGLNALDGLKAITDRRGGTILTPHAGEFARLVGEEASWQAARRVAEQTGATVVLKGWPTFVAEPGRVVAVTSGGPELATIGTGDVLSGMIAAAWASGQSEPVAARTGAHWHGRTGARLAEKGIVTADQLANHVGSFLR